MARLAANEDFLRWFKDNGGFVHEALEFAEHTNSGVHLRVKPGCDAIGPETTLLKCPFDLSISFLNALNIQPFEAHSSQLPPTAFLEQANDRSILAYFIVQQYLQGDDSFWASYIRSLPQPFEGDLLGGPVCWGEEDLEWLAETSAFSQVTAMRDNLRSQWLGLDKSGLLPGEFSWELFRWATEIVDSRSFTSTVLQDLIAGNKSVEEAVSKRPTFDLMLPMIDALNHSGTADVQWLYNRTTFDWITRSGLEAGNEIFNNYGVRSNAELLLRYGFCSVNNPFDRFVVGVIGDQSVLQTHDQELFYIRSPHFFEMGYEDVGYQHGIPWLRQIPDRLVQLLASQFRDSRSMDNTSTPHTGCPSYAPLDPLAILKVTAQLRTLLCAQLDRLRSAGARLPNAPRNTKQVNSKIYRESQLSILETTVKSINAGLNESIVQDSDIGSAMWSSTYPRFESRRPRLLRLNTAFQLFQAGDHRGHKALVTALKQCCGTSHVKKLRDAGWEDVVWTILLACMLFKRSSGQLHADEAPMSQITQGSNDIWATMSDQFRGALQYRYQAEARSKSKMSFETVPWQDLVTIKNAAADSDPSSKFAWIGSSLLMQAWTAYCFVSIPAPVSLIEHEDQGGEETLVYMWYENGGF